MELEVRAYQTLSEMVEMDDEIARRLEVPALVGIDIDLRAPIGRLLDVHDIAVAEIAGAVACREPASSRDADSGDVDAS